MSEEKKKTWMITLPYDDVRGMEKRSELLEETKNDVLILKNSEFTNSNVMLVINRILDRINEKGDK